jgi:hypothetical protein
MVSKVCSKWKLLNSYEKRSRIRVTLLVFGGSPECVSERLTDQRAYSPLAEIVVYAKLFESFHNLVFLFGRQ